MSKKAARRARAAPPPPPVGKGAARSVSRIWLYGGLGAVVLVAVIVLIAVSQLGGGESTAEPPPVAAGSETAALLDGIPQDGMVLGSPDAPVTIVEYADVQCPFCAQWSYGAFPDLVREYVRAGEVRLVFNGMAFLGPESEAGLRAVIAAGEQGKAWNVLHLLFENQGTENGGWLTDGLVRELGATVPGLDVDLMVERSGSQEVTDRIAEAAGVAEAAGISSTPSFQIGPTGGTLERLEIESLGIEAIRPSVDALLGP